MNKAAVAATSYTDSFGFQWNKHARTQLDSFTGAPISENRLFQTTQWARDLTGQTILEAGSGAGRFTEILLSTGARITSFDDSSAVEANQRNNGGHPNLNLFRASIYSIPGPKNSFDKVLCLGVLQHTPDPEKAFRRLAEQVKPGGKLVVDVYAKHLTFLRWKYLLRPFTTRMDQQRLYRTIESVVPRLCPLAAWLKRHAGRVGAHFLPIVEYSQLGLRPDHALDLAILDTFDMYSPKYDQPQTISTLKRWFESCGFEDIVVERGYNGIIGRGSRREG